MPTRIVGVLLTLFLIGGAKSWAQGDYLQGVAYYQQKQYRRAIAEFQAIVEAQPDYEFGHRILGLSYLKVKQFDKALEAFLEAIRLKSDQFVSFSGLAMAYFNLGRYDEVISSLNQAEKLARSPRDKYQLHKTRGASAFNVGAFEKAVGDLEKAISLVQRGNIEDLLQLGIAHYHLGNDAKSRRYLAEVLSRQASQVEATRFLSQLDFREGVKAIELKQYDRATQVLKAYVEQVSDDPEGWFNLGLGYLFADRLRAAEEAFLRASRLAPNSSKTFDRLGYIHETNGEYRKALEAYRKAFELAPQPEVKESVERIRKRLSQAG